MPRFRRSLVALSMSAAVMLSACAGPLEQAQENAPVVQGPSTGLPLLPPEIPSPLPVVPPHDELPGGYGWPTWGDCSDSLAC
jgi:hypothetical protein